MVEENQWFINEKFPKLYKKNKEENQKIEVHFLALKNMLKKNYKDNKYLGGKIFLIQWNYWGGQNQMMVLEKLLRLYDKKFFLLLKKIRLKIGYKFKLRVLFNMFLALLTLAR